MTQTSHHGTPLGRSLVVALLTDGTGEREMGIRKWEMENRKWEGDSVVLQKQSGRRMGRFMKHFLDPRNTPQPS